MPPESLAGLLGHAKATAAAGRGPGFVTSRPGSSSPRDGRGRGGNAMDDGEVAPLSAEELAQRLEQYRTFRDQVLLPELGRLQQREARLREDVEEYERLQANARGLMEAQQSSLDTRVDIGCQVYCQAHVPDTSRLFVSIGLGFMVECAPQEVACVTAPRLEHLRAQLDAAGRKAEAARVHVGQVDESVEELARLGSHEVRR